MTRDFSASTCIILSGILLFLGNACVKSLTRIPPHEILFIRSAISIVFTYFIIRKMGVSLLGNNRPMLIVRGLAGNLGIWLNFITLQSMPIASAVTIQYTLPIMTVIFGIALLGERPTLRQVPLIFAAFFGVLMIKGYDSRISGIGMALGLLSAASNAFALTIIRKLREQDHALTVMFYLPLIGCLFWGPATLSHWTQPQGIEYFLLVVIGILFQIGQYFLTLGFQKEKAANIANLNYLSILYAVLTGLFLFGEKVETLALGGMVIIIGASILSQRTK